MYTHADDKLRQEERCGTIAGSVSTRREATRHLWLHLSIAWRAGSDVRGRGHVCVRIKQTFICKRLLFWPGFQIGYQGLRSLSSASLFTVCKSSVWICEKRLSLFCSFCSPVQVFFSSFCCLVHWFEHRDWLGWQNNEFAMHEHIKWKGWVLPTNEQFIHHLCRTGTGWKVRCSFVDHKIFLELRSKTV